MGLESSMLRKKERKGGRKKGTRVGQGSTKLITCYFVFKRAIFKGTSTEHFEEKSLTLQDKWDAVTETHTYRQLVCRVRRQ